MRAKSLIPALLACVAVLPQAYGQAANPAELPPAAAPADPAASSPATIAPGSATRAKTGKKVTGSRNGKPLDLKAPDVRTVVPAEELKEPLPDAAQEEQTEEAATVQVKTESDAPVVLGGFASLWWALNHPSQAWRIVAPIE